MKLKEILITSLIASIFASMITVWVMAFITSTNTQEELIQGFYESEVATNISAHGLRKKIALWETNFVLVDVRSEEEYLEWHIKGAISIPAYTDRDNTQSTSNDRILTAFSEISPDKEIITYCYSSYCMTSRKIGKFLAANDVYVKHLTVWWNEWRYHWDLWNYPHEEDRTEDFIASWEDPWALEASKEADIWACGISGDFGC